MNDKSFEGQMSGLDFIKTPDQVPDRLDFAQVPENVLRSNVIESLINQNDDLMSRLTVSLRRIAQLEEKLTDATSKNTQYKVKYDNMRDQLLVMREQSRIIAERSRLTEERVKRDDNKQSELAEQVEVLEIRYAELYTSTQEKIAKLESQISRESNTAGRYVRRYSKYRKNIQLAIRSLKQEMIALRTKREVLEVSLSDLRKNLAESTQYISDSAKNHKIQITELTATYENQILELKNNITEINDRCRVLSERALDYEKILGDKVKSENELIIARRREEDLQIATAAEIHDLQKSLNRFRSENKDLAIELDGKIKELESVNSSFDHISEENDKLNEQVETLQALWRDQQTQVEKLSEQKTSLQKLNQELSIALNEFRRENRELKEKIDALELRAIAQKNEDSKKEQMLKELKASEDKSASATQTQSEVKREDLLTPEIMTKIDKVLSNLHIGH